MPACTANVIKFLCPHKCKGTALDEPSQPNPFLGVGYTLASHTGFLSELVVKVSIALSTSLKDPCIVGCAGNLINDASYRVLCWHQKCLLSIYHPSPWCQNCLVPCLGAPSLWVPGMAFNSSQGGCAPPLMMGNVEHAAGCRLAGPWRRPPTANNRILSGSRRQHRRPAWQSFQRPLSPTPELDRELREAPFQRLEDVQQRPACSLL